MARKLNSDEERHFIECLEKPDPAKPESQDKAEQWVKLSRKRDKALSLTPELEEWFGKEFPPEFYF